MSFPAISGFFLARARPTFYYYFRTCTAYKYTCTRTYSFTCKALPGSLPLTEVYHTDYLVLYTYCTGIDYCRATSTAAPGMEYWYLHVFNTRRARAVLRRGGWEYDEYNHYS